MSAPFVGFVEFIEFIEFIGFVEFMEFIGLKHSQEPRNGDE